MVPFISDPLLDIADVDERLAVAGGGALPLLRYLPLLLLGPGGRRGSSTGGRTRLGKSRLYFLNVLHVYYIHLNKVPFSSPQPSSSSGLGSACPWSSRSPRTSSCPFWERRRKRLKECLPPEEVGVEVQVEASGLRPGGFWKESLKKGNVLHLLYFD